MYQIFNEVVWWAMVFVVVGAEVKISVEVEIVLLA